MPGSGIRDRKTRRGRSTLPPKTTPEQADAAVREALTDGKNLEMVYVTRDDKHTLTKVAPERLAINREGLPVLVARNLDRDERLTYRMSQIERIRTIPVA